MLIIVFLLIMTIYLYVRNNNVRKTNIIYMRYELFHFVNKCELTWNRRWDVYILISKEKNLRGCIELMILESLGRFYNYWDLEWIEENSEILFGFLKDIGVLAKILYLSFRVFWVIWEHHYILLKVKFWEKYWSYDSMESLNSTWWSNCIVNLIQQFDHLQKDWGRIWEW